jgi:hypothetical protein
VLVRPLRHGRGDARRHAIERAAQPDDDPEPTHVRAVLVADRSAAARVDHHPGGRALEAHQDARLELAEALHAVLLDDVLAGPAHTALDLAVDFDDRCAEMMREDRSDARLADAWRTDEEDVHLSAARVDRPESAPVPLDRGAQVVHVVVAELLAERVGEDKGEHRLGHHAGRWNDADVAALDVRR